ncbi:MAG: chemotaxis-specific protein-glutamate methyltransferase CheB [Gemmatimonadaceae bacterium]
MRQSKRVLVVDDSAFMRRLITEIVESRPEFLVVGTARDGSEAVRKVRSLRPDIVTLDIEMPGIDGLTALSQIMSEMPRPVVMLSAAGSDTGNAATIRSLELGAVEFVRKPSGPVSVDLALIRTELLRALAAAAMVRLGPPVELQRVEVVLPTAARRPFTPTPAGSAVVVASSTGGPKALADFVSHLPDCLSAAVLIVQHMPSDFLATFARRLAQLGPFPVSVACDGQRVMARNIYLAPGNVHMSVVRHGASAIIKTDAGPAICGVRPSADPLFSSAAAIFGANLVGVVLTGMGKDGTEGLRAVRAAGGGAIVQDRASSIIYGMPRSALTIAGADRVVAPRLIGSAIVDLFQSRQAVA